VFTPAYRSGSRISRPALSLAAQAHDNWEWVVFDDSDDGGETFGMLAGMADREPRMRVYRESRRSGRIGNVKRSACGLCRGKYLVELDHDDELAPDALGLVARAFEAHPEAGFVYTDCAECFEDGSPVTYPDGWGMGYGRYRDEVVGGIRYKAIVSPNINPKVIRHIVAAPNHIRAWRSDVYARLGGHRDMMHVADDYELVVRSFLATRMVRVPRMCYVQYRNEAGNTHRARNAEIQRLVRRVSMFYDEAIHRRLLELGVDDFVWDGKTPSFYRMMTVPNPTVESHCTITFEDRPSFERS
jgi:glycosyltransferase involved in cell wall biosynthesis